MKKLIVALAAVLALPAQAQAPEVVYRVLELHLGRASTATGSLKLYHAGSGYALTFAANSGMTGDINVTGPTTSGTLLTSGDLGSIAITGGSITGITDLAVADGGTGASDAATARTNLAAQQSNAHLDDLADGTLTGSKVGVFTGDSGSGGTVGAVPAPAAGDAAANKFLKADATWAVAGEIGGSTGSVANAILLADGTGGGTVKAGVCTEATNVLSCLASSGAYDIKAGVSGGTTITLGAFANNPYLTSNNPSIYIGSGVSLLPWTDNNAGLGTLGSRWATGFFTTATATTLVGATVRPLPTSGTDQTGNTLTVAGGTGTGAGTSGSILFQTSTPTVSGTTPQSLTTRMTIDTDSVDFTVPILTTAGTSLVPGLRIGEANSGLSIGSNALYFVHHGNTVFYMSNDWAQVGIPSNVSFVWSSTTTAGSAPDTSLQRSAAGVVRLRANNNANLGYILANAPVEVVTTTKSPTIYECGETYTSTGDADGTAFTLLDNPEIGCELTFINTVATTMTIAPSASETISGVATTGVLDNAGTAAVFTTSCTSGTQWATIKLKAAIGGSAAPWVPIAYTGPWTCS